MKNKIFHIQTIEKFYNILDMDTEYLGTIIFLVIFVAIISLIVFLVVINSKRNGFVRQTSKAINDLNRANKKLVECKLFKQPYVLIQGTKSTLNSLYNWNGKADFIEYVTLHLEELENAVCLAKENDKVINDYRKTVSEIQMSKKLPKNCSFSFKSYSERERKIFKSNVKHYTPGFTIKFEKKYVSPKGRSTTIKETHFTDLDVECVISKIKNPALRDHFIVNPYIILQDSNLNPFTPPSVTSFVAKNSASLTVPFDKSDLQISEFSDGIALNEEENINPGTIGLVVDYLTRFIKTKSFFKSFAIPAAGAIHTIDEETEVYRNLIRGLDDTSIIMACKLCTFDIVYRVGKQVTREMVERNVPNQKTIQNIRTMVNRTLQLNDTENFEDCSLTFKNGYTSKVGKGDADLLANGCLIDLKTSKNEPGKADFLQICIYYLLGKNSHKGIYSKTKSVAIFNPRLNKYYKYTFSPKDKKNWNALAKSIGIHK